ncbi:hypothetical protein SO802_015072 [Lithocarpus litseifolius]|uniref:Yippee domain-containing protein n=1 Tax=Lithocarpus litseifolius TaxID=425828 RepID=A0AAW2CW84_9ROSI
MGRIFVVELEGRSYRCKFCKTHLALVEDLVSRGEPHSWSIRGEADDFRFAYCGRHILLLLWTDCGLEICTFSLPFPMWHTSISRYFLNYRNERFGHRAWQLLLTSDCFLHPGGCT